VSEWGIVPSVVSEGGGGRRGGGFGRSFSVFFEGLPEEYK
jgi:hypothetical protein